MNARNAALLLMLTTVFASPVAYSVNNRFCQKGVFVYFGNGVWNDFAGADESRFLLEERLAR